MKNNKYLKVMFGKTSGADSNFEYKINEVNIANNWNPNAKDPKEMGGFNFSTETKILRWLVRGDTIYDVIIPDDAEIVECESESAPHGVFRTNKIILLNPRKITDDIAMEIYLKSDLPEKSYYKALAGLAIRGHSSTCKKLIKARINRNNIDLVLNEIADFITPDKATGGGNIEVYNEVINILNNIKAEK